MRRKKQETDDQQESRLLTHVTNLGLDSVKAYQDWCAEHGFGRGLYKSSRQRDQERRQITLASAEKKLRSEKRNRNHQLATLTAIIYGKRPTNDFANDAMHPFVHETHRLFYSKWDNDSELQSLERLVVHLHGCKSKLVNGELLDQGRGLVEGNTYLELLVRIAACSEHWLRPIDEWKPTSRNTQRQFESLVSHLFSQYGDTPPFFHRLVTTDWDWTSDKQRTWYLHIGRGQNIRTCDLPIDYTKKMGHYFMQAPRDVSIAQALRWGQARAFGCDERLTRALIATRLGTEFDHDEFWSTVIRWFAANPMLDKVHVGPIIDFLYYQRFARQEVFDDNRLHMVPPPQPQLSMRGRTPESLLRQVQQWHQQLGKAGASTARQWPSNGIDGFHYMEGIEGSDNLKLWTIRELLDSKSLQHEGRQMKHCVATYASSCARGICSIWSMEVETGEGKAKALTLEVNHRSRTLCQARGKLNRQMTPKERNIVNRWTAKVGLRITKYV